MTLPHLFLTLLLVLVWGFNFVMITVGLEGLPPIFLCAVRFIFTSIPGIFLVKFPSTSLKMVSLYGLILFALQFALLFMGMYAGVSSGLAALLLQMQVFFSVVLGVIFLKEKLTFWQVIGALVSFSGIGLIGTHISGDFSFLGFFLVILSALFWAIGSLITKRIGRVNMISLVTWGSLIAWPPLLALSFIVEGPTEIFSSLNNLSWQSLAATLYIAYLSTTVGYGTWGWLLHHYSLTYLAPFTLLVPVIAMVSSMLVLGEPLQTWKFQAGILIIAGLCINLLFPRIFRKKPS